jgi:hypothetical protein
MRIDFPFASFEPEALADPPEVPTVSLDQALIG